MECLIVNMLVPKFEYRCMHLLTKINKFESFSNDSFPLIHACTKKGIYMVHTPFYAPFYFQQ